MHCLYETNFNFVYDDSFYDLYLEYLIQKSNLKQNVLIKEIDIPSSTFTRVKRKGYSTNKIVKSALENYFNVQNVSNDIIQKLQKNLDTVITYAYYSETQNEKELFDETLKLNEATKNSPIRLLYWCLLSIAYNPVLALSSEAMDILNDEVDFIEYMLEYLPADSKFIVTYALYEYALHKDDFTLASKYTLKIEELLPQSSLSLQSLGNFICMTMAIINKDQSKAFKFINRSLELQNTYFAPNIFVSTKFHLFSLYNAIHDYEKMIDLGEREIIYLQFAMKDQAFYYSYLLGLAQAYVELEKFEEAENIFNIIDNYNYDDYVISPGQVKVFKLKKDVLNLNKLLMYYKLKKDKEFEKTASLCESLNLNIYVDIIRLIKKGNINSLKKANKLLIEQSKNINGLTSQIQYVLTNELKSLLNK